MEAASAVLMIYTACVLSGGAIPPASCAEDLNYRLGILARRRRQYSSTGERKPNMIR